VLRTFSRSDASGERAFERPPSLGNQDETAEHGLVVINRAAALGWMVGDEYVSEETSRSLEAELGIRRAQPRDAVAEGSDEVAEVLKPLHQRNVGGSCYAGGGTPRSLQIFAARMFLISV
jgi:hypothetical protein